MTKRRRYYTEVNLRDVSGRHSMVLVVLLAWYLVSARLLESKTESTAAILGFLAIGQCTGVPDAKTEQLNFYQPWPWEYDDWYVVKNTLTLAVQPSGDQT